MGLFAVDQWRCKSQLYFLTHMHADHTNGLSPSWCRGPIYCSAVTAGLLLNKFQGLDDTLVHTLEVGITALISIPHQQAETMLLEVTPILANHCPGAVMYLFRGEFGCVLHTGDFRWDSSAEVSIEGKQQLLAALEGGSVDRLHLDNTFCHPCFNFPPRRVAMQQILQIIANHPLHDIIIGVDSLGKEELLLEIAQAFDTKIWVWPERLQTMRLLGLPDIFTTDSTATRIRAVPRYSMSNSNLQMLNNIFRPTIGILPTGCLCLCRPACWNVGGQSEGQHMGSVDSCKMSNAVPQQDHPGGELLLRPAERDLSRRDAMTINQCVCSMSPIGAAEGIHMIKYSLHCSYSELESFIRTVKPKVVIGIVPSPGGLETDPSQHFRCLLEEETAGHVPTVAGTGLRRLKLVQTPRTSVWNYVLKRTGPRTKRLPQKVSNFRQEICSRLNTFCRPRKKGVGTQLLASLEEEHGEICPKSVITSQATRQEPMKEAEWVD